jgi:hypothetical protein
MFLHDLALYVICFHEFLFMLFLFHICLDVFCEVLQEIGDLLSICVKKGE